MRAIREDLPSESLIFFGWNSPDDIDKWLSTAGFSNYEIIQIWLNNQVLQKKREKAFADLPKKIQRAIEAYDRAQWGTESWDEYKKIHSSLTFVELRAVVLFQEHLLTPAEVPKVFPNAFKYCTEDHSIHPVDQELAPAKQNDKLTRLTSPVKRKYARASQ